LNTRGDGPVHMRAAHLEVAMPVIGVPIRRFQVSTVGSRERGDQSPRRPEFLRANMEMARL
jgi:hypothetical protein